MDRNYIILNRNTLKKCPCCGAGITDRTARIHSEMVVDLAKVYRWCIEKGTHVFAIREIKDLLSKSSYANFSKFIRFGKGIAYRPKLDDRDDTTDPSKYGLNMNITRDFLAGRRTIIFEALINQITDEVINKKEGFVYELPSVMDYLKANGLYDPETKQFIQPEVPKKRVLEVDPVHKVARYVWK